MSQYIFSWNEINHHIITHNNTPQGNSTGWLGRQTIFTIPFNIFSIKLFQFIVCFMDDPKLSAVRHSQARAYVQI